MEKTGYRLIFYDDFNSSTLDEKRWIPEYLPSWAASSEAARPSYEIVNSLLKLRIDEDRKPWNLEYDGDTRVSGIMTGKRNGLHNWTGKNQVRQKVETCLSSIVQYGYFELRAKIQRGGGIHSAWWLIGFEDTPGESVEIDLFEILGRSPNEITTTKHPWKDANVQYETVCYSPKNGVIKGRYAFAAEDEYVKKEFENLNVDLSDEFHVYGFEWTKEEMIFYFDGIPYRRMPNEVFYPLITVLSIYEKRDDLAWTGPFDPTLAYPKVFEIDYLRIYKKIPPGYKAVPEKELIITGQESLSIQLSTKKLTSPDETYVAQFPTYITVYYNDGTETQEAVKWNRLKDSEIAYLETAGRKYLLSGVLATIGLSNKFKATTVFLEIEMVE